MGNTIRRQPISSKIPASPNYRFLNITDFKGLDISDNPFILKPNTASDLLNVYVDENNALSTRPRLEKTHDFSWLIGDGELIGVYNITDGYLIHVNVDGVYKMYKHPVDAENNEISGDIPTAKCFVFEKNDTIYMLDGNKYYALKDMNIGAVEPYIPTTVVGGTSETKGNALEALNILSDVYKETYYWNEFKMPYTNESDVVSVENYTYIATDVYEQTMNYDIIAYKNKQMILREKSTGKLCVGVFTNDFEKIEITPTNHVVAIDGVKFAIAENALTFFTINMNDSQQADNWQYSVVGLDIVKTQVAFGFSGLIPENAWISCSSDGDCLFVSMGDSDVTCYSMKKKSAWSIYAGAMPVYGADIVDGTLYLCALNRLFSLSGFYDKYGSSMPVLEETYINIATSLKLTNVSKYKNGLYAYDKKTGRGCYVTDQFLPNIPSETIKHNNVTDKGVLGFSYTNNSVMVSFFEDNQFYTQTSHVTIDDLAEETTYSLVFKYDISDDVFVLTRAEGGVVILKRKNATEPLLIVVRKITNSEELEKIEKQRTLFAKSTLGKRFENNWWFASGNTLFRTENNDPTYIPLDEELELGDSKDPITGLNIAQDDLLLAYKKNNIYAIQPAEVYDRLTYTTLETKNVSGNNAIGSPIVTALTEMPVHISYDGIFALKQLKNVQSSDRISELISDNINKRWLKESKSAIDNCQTINRLYWTYFVLKERNVAKVYLLDNRTQSWFYWELPITCINVFVKDETTIFVDENGMVYKLTTDDIINEYNKDVTEYYDNGKKLIKWFWKSQILPLGTINYSKKLVDTTFIVADTDDSDEYGLNYKFRAYRKLVSESNETTISNRLNYVQSTTKKTLIPRFNFLQLEISNVEDDLNNNKLRLLGLGLKYVLLEGLL